MLTLSHLQRALGGEITGGQLSAPGPGHSSADRSMTVKLAPNHPGGFVVHSKASDDDMACRDYIKSRAGIDDRQPRNSSRPMSPSASPTRDDIEQRKQRAVALWNEAVDPRGTLVETYLRSRGLDLPAEMAMEVIRFHRSCPFGKGERHPCMIAAFHSIETGELVAIHRTALKPDGRKIDRKMMGPVSGAAIKLESIAGGSKTIVVGEGIETCLSARAAGISPVWAMGSADAIARFPVLPDIEAIGILGEIDDSGASQKATQSVGDRWHASGRDVHLFLPTEGKDINDALQVRGPDAAVTIGAFEPTPKPPVRDAVIARAVEPDMLVDGDGIVTQDWIAQLFAAEFGGRLRYCHHAGAWHDWTGSHWQRDQTDLAFNFVRVLGRRMTDGATAEDIKQVRRVTFASGVERFARADRTFAVTSDHWDADPFMLGTPGGTVDLRTGKLRPADQADGITKVTACAPSNQIDCPRWLQFLDETFGGDAEIARFAQQWAGYSLTGDTREHALVFGYGGGGNGKSVFLNVITGIMQDYAVTAAMETFIASNSERHPTDLAMLRGARMVTASETEEGRAWAESRLKQLTGGDKISARFMRQDFFEFRPSFKLLIVGNHRPVLKNIDEAARRRFNLLPFLLKPANPDRQLEEKLKAEWPGILRWMIAGCLDWQANGLIRPKSVIDATAAYFEEQDLLSQWLAEECDVEPGNSYKSDTIADLYASWADFAMKAGEETGTKKQLSGLLQKRGFERCSIGHSNARGFKGIRVKPKVQRDRD